MKTATKTAPLKAPDFPKPRWRETVTTITKRFATVKLMVPPELVESLKATECTPAEAIANLCTMSLGDRYWERSEPAKEQWRRRCHGVCLRDAPKRWAKRARKPLVVELPSEVWMYLKMRSAQAGVSVHDWALASLDYRVRIHDPEWSKRLLKALEVRFPGPGNPPLPDALEFVRNFK